MYEMESLSMLVAPDTRIRASAILMSLSFRTPYCGSS